MINKQFRINNEREISLMGNTGGSGDGHTAAYKESKRSKETAIRVVRTENLSAIPADYS